MARRTTVAYAALAVADTMLAATWRGRQRWLTKPLLMPGAELAGTWPAGSCPGQARGIAMHLFECEATFEADPDAVWKVWTDVARWPDWDVSKEMARLDGPFEPGVSGWAKQRGNLGGAFTITEVDAGRRWVTECPVPLGKVIFDHSLEQVGGGRV